MSKRSISDVNIRKISTLLNKMPEYKGLPMSNIKERDVVDISGNKIKVRLDNSFITIDIRKPKDLDPNVLSAVVGALKKERSALTEDYIIEQVTKGVKFRKSQITKLEGRGIKHFKERYTKISNISNLDKISRATFGWRSFQIEGVVRAFVESMLSSIKNTDRLFEMLYFQPDYYGASGYNKGELLGFVDWLSNQGYIDLDDLLLELFNYSGEDDE